DEIGEPTRLMLVLVPEPLAHVQIPFECGSRSVIARLPATAGSMSEALRYPPSRRSEWCHGSHVEVVDRSATRLRRIGAAQSRGYAGTDAPPGARSHGCRRD